MKAAAGAGQHFGFQFGGQTIGGVLHLLIASLLSEPLVANDGLAELVALAETPLVWQERDVSQAPTP